MAQVERPNKTLYVRNLDESIKLPILKEELQTIFSQFGNVINVIAHKNIRMRGQAFVVFEEQLAAEKALGSVQKFPFHGKQMEVHYARSQSDDTVKRERGEEEFEEHKKQRLQAKGTNPVLFDILDIELTGRNEKRSRRGEESEDGSTGAYTTNKKTTSRATAHRLTSPSTQQGLVLTESTGFYNQGAISGYILAIRRVPRSAYGSWTEGDCVCGI